MPVEKSAGVIVFCKDFEKIEYLLLERVPGEWSFPKGLVEKGEKIEEAALRECREETGLENLKIIPGFKEIIRFFFKAKYEYQLARGFKMGDAILKFATYFLAQSDSYGVKISKEHINFGWFLIGEAKGKLRKSNFEVLQKADAFLRNQYDTV